MQRSSHKARPNFARPRFRTTLGLLVTRCSMRSIPFDFALDRRNLSRLTRRETSFSRSWFFEARRMIATRTAPRKHHGHRNKSFLSTRLVLLLRDLFSRRWASKLPFPCILASLYHPPHTPSSDEYTVPSSSGFFATPFFVVRSSSSPIPSLALPLPLPNP